MPFLSKPTRRIGRGRRPRPKRVPAAPEPKPATRPVKPVPTGASAYFIEARQELGAIFGDRPWTKTELARTLGVKYLTLVRWESGRKTPTQGGLDIVARILELARRGVDPRQITAPDIEVLLSTPGPEGRRKMRSIVRHEDVEPATRLFRPSRRE